MSARSLKFIADAQFARKRGESSRHDGFNNTSTAQESDKDVDSKEHILCSQGCDIDMTDDDECSDTDRSTPSVTTAGAPTIPVSWRLQRNKEEPVAKRKKTCQKDEILRKVCQNLNSLSSESLRKDEFDCFGQTVAYGLRNMSKEQAIHAKKRISDVLYEGQLGTLSTVFSVFPTTEKCNNSSA
ncbi:uncharacterized protein LOC118477841 isoform X2 [Aplysia californica]|uniref:Uncharacterized protein LOC118477841 isoform X2 n=1 Tax=Aplysia californica TaxID=6500 RepID=A0ABM1VUR6_APLCA|nr:uncharacterized protein LOC118477841 isoform X2 [Aplysia californica]